MKSMTMNLSDAADIRLALHTNQTASTSEARGLSMEVTHGSVWVTFEGKRDDYVLNPGERLPISERGRIVIQGLEQSEIRFVRVSEPTPGIRSSHRDEHPGECWRNFVGSLNTARVNIDQPI